jgi:hypothetical protein
MAVRVWDSAEGYGNCFGFDAGRKMSSTARASHGDAPVRRGTLGRGVRIVLKDNK